MFQVCVDDPDVSMIGFPPGGGDDLLRGCSEGVLDVLSVARALDIPGHDECLRSTLYSRSVCCWEEAAEHVV